MRGYIVLKPGDIWKFRDTEGTTMHYLVLSYFEKEDGYVRVKEMETGFLEVWINPFQPANGKWKRVG